MSERETAPPAKRYRWYGLTEWFGYKVGVTAYENGLLVVWWPCGLVDRQDRRAIRQCASGDIATGYARIIEQGITSIREDLTTRPFNDAVAVREVTGL